jgi:FkbM family methyltransferase
MHYDFIEIGTSDFETEIQNCDDKTVGLSIEPIKYYLDNLPDKPYVTKVNCAVSDHDGKIKVYYVSEENIRQYNYPEFLRGCNAINAPHPVTKGFVFGIYVPDQLIECLEVEVKSVKTLFDDYNVESIGYLKVDTEGHDCTIINNYYELCKNNPRLFADKILFESNPLANKDEVEKIIQKFVYSEDSIYELVSTGEDTVFHKKV